MFQVIYIYCDLKLYFRKKSDASLYAAPSAHSISESSTYF